MTAAGAPDDPSTAVAGAGHRAYRRTVVSDPLAWSAAAAVAVCVAVAFPALFALLGDLVGIAVIAVLAVVPWLLAVHDRRTDLPSTGDWCRSERADGARSAPRAPRASRAPRRGLGTGSGEGPPSGPEACR
jgi:hypothetical protein